MDRPDCNTASRAGCTRTGHHMRQIALIVAGLLGLPGGVEGATLAFTSSAAFFSAVDDLTVSTETFETLAPNTILSAGTTFHGLTYEVFPPGADGRIDPTFVALGQHGLGLRRVGIPDDFGGFFFPGDAVTINFVQPTRAVGVFFNVDISPPGSLQMVTVAGTAGNGPVYDVLTLYFVGLLADAPFTQATLRGLVNAGSGFTLDEISYETVVPEPAVASLAVLALAIVGRRTRRASLRIAP